MELKLRKPLMYAFTALLTLLLTYSLLLIFFPHVKNVSPTSGSVVLNKSHLSCEQDYCGEWVLGSCIGKGQRYRERECYQYPDGIMKAGECEANKKIYIDKGSQPDASC
jgi:hypothetical protein